MMVYSNAEIWLIIALMGLGTFGLRFSFLGFFANRDIPPWLLRHLRYTAVAILPGLVAPLVLWPGATGGAPDPARIIAALLALVVGYFLKSAIWAIVTGMGLFYLLGYAFG
jgi:branched-subunit amino acid transport protein